MEIEEAEGRITFLYSTVNYYYYRTQENRSLG